MDVDEDYHIDGILETITLSDYFSTGDYELNLWSGNLCMVVIKMCSWS